MACSFPHTDSEVEALVQKLIDEDKGQSRALIDTFLKEGPDKDYELNLSMSGKAAKKELHQLHLEEDALRETLEEKAMDEKAREEKIRQKQADDDEFFMEFGVVRYDSEYESLD
ncbi:hypothetical protein Tco_0150000 [Tanacetum coccineum]